MADAGGAGASLGHAGVAERGRLFHAWRRYSEDEFSHSDFSPLAKPLHARFRRLLSRGESSPDKHGRAPIRGRTRLWPTLKAFLGTKGVDPHEQCR